MFRRLAPRLWSVSRAAAPRLSPIAARSIARGSAVVVGTGATLVLCTSPLQASEPAVDYDAVRHSVEEVLEDLAHDDGSFGPIFIRLAWHASGTYNKNDGTGGSGTGASMRFPPEAQWGANAGLHKARQRLEAVKAKHPGISYADLWTLAGVVALEAMGGPTVQWRPGREDCTAQTCPKLPDGLLPDATQGPQHLRDVFYRMGFNDQEIVALSGAHTLGRCHTDASGFVNPWTNAPTTFSNLYFVELLNNKWTKKRWKGPVQYEDPTGTLMMLPTDMCLLDDPEFRRHVERYAADEDVFFKEFGVAFGKLLELGVKFPKPWYKFW